MIWRFFNLMPKFEIKFCEKLILLRYIQINAYFCNLK
jgi:hypothetical protein